MDNEKIVVWEFKYWVLLIHPNQNYLGRVYAWPRREIFQPTENDSAEWAELLEIFQLVKIALDNLFSPKMYNWVSHNNSTKICHWHIIPRHEKPAEFFGNTIPDMEFGRVHNFSRKVMVTREFRTKLAGAIANEIKKLKA